MFSWCCEILSDPPASPKNIVSEPQNWASQQIDSCLGLWACCVFQGTICVSVKLPLSSCNSGVNPDKFKMIMVVSFPLPVWRIWILCPVLAKIDKGKLLMVSEKASPIFNKGGTGRNDPSFPSGCCVCIGLLVW